MACANNNMIIYQGQEKEFILTEITITATYGTVTVFDWTDKNITLVIGDSTTDYGPTITNEIYQSTITPTAGTESLLFTIPSSITDTMDISNGSKYKYRIIFDGERTDLYPVEVNK